jgi:fibronectin-binding autotransporter adhesin
MNKALILDSWLLSLVVIIVLALSGPTPAVYAGQDWDGTGGDDFWSTAGNWNLDTLPDWGLAIRFGGTTRTSTFNDLAEDTLIGGINFTNTINGQSFTLAGSRIILGGNVVTSSLTGGVATDVIENVIEFDILLNGNRTFTTASSTINGVHNLTIRGDIGETGGNFGITKNGTTLGVLALTGANTFTGTVTLTSGIISFNTVANAGQPSALGAGDTIIAGNSGGSTGTLLYTGTGHETNRQIQVGTGTATSTVGLNIQSDGSGGLVFTNNSFNALFSTSTATKPLTLRGSSTSLNAINGVIANNNTGGGGLISLTKSGSGNWALGGANTYTGTTTVTAGLLRLENANALPGGVGASGGASSLLFNGSGVSGGVIGLTAATGDFLRAIGGTNPTSEQVGWSSGATGGFAAFGGNRIVNFGGAGAAVTWNSTNGFLGGGLILGHATSDSTVTVVNNIALNSATRTIIVNDGSAAVDGIMSGVISGTGSFLVKSGPGTLALTGLNTFGSAISSGNTFTTINNGVLQIGNGGTTGALTQSGSGDIQNDAVLAFNRSNAMTVQYIVKGTGSVRQIGTGTTTMTGTNTYSGGTEINAGGLIFSKASAMPTTGTVTVAAGALLGVAVSSSGDFFTSSDLNGLFSGSMTNVTNDAASVVGIDTTAGNFTYASNIPASARGLTKLGNNTLALTGSNAYTGATRITGGILDVGTISDGALGTGPLFFTNNAVLQGNGTFTRAFSGSSVTAEPGQLTGVSGGFAARGGTLTINFGGLGSTVTLNFGAARFGTNFVFGSAEADSRVVVVNPLALGNASRTFTVNTGAGGDLAELQGIISSTTSTDGLIKAGPGRLILSANNTYTGSTTISNGILQLGNGGTTGAIDNTSGITNNATLAFSRSNSLTVSVGISGSGLVEQVGIGTTRLSGINSYSGGTQVNTGTLIFLNTNAKPASGTTTVAAGATLGLGVGSSGTLFNETDVNSLFSGTLANVINDTNSRVGIDTTAGDFTFATSIAASPRGLTKLGNNTLSLAGTNAYTGSTTVISGILRLDSAGALPGGIGSSGGTSNLTLAGGVIGLTSTSGDFTRGVGSGAEQVRWITDTASGFAAFGGNRTVNFGGAATPSMLTWSNANGVLGSRLILSDSTSDSTITILNPIALSFVNSPRTITVNDGSAEVDAVMAGALTSSTGSGNGTRLIKNGNGTLALTAANSYVSGSINPGTTISAGTLMVGNGGSTGSLLYLPSTTGINSDVSISSGATFAFNRSDSGLVLANTIIGDGQVRQIGTGITTVSGANTFSGGTTVSAGTLLATNVTGSATGTGLVTTAENTILGGTGTLAPTGSNGISIGGQVAPGLVDAIGTLTFAPENGDVAFLGTSRLLFRLGGNENNDLLNFNPTGTGLIDFSGMNPGAIRVLFFGGYTPALGHRFDLIDWSALAINGLNAGLLNFDEVPLLDSNWMWDTSDFVSSGVISVALIPEPGRMMLCLVGGLMGLLRRRRSV